MMKVIFLDVDGVLNCEATFRSGRHGDDAIEPTKVSLVADLVRETDAKIVISSTWRLGRGGLTRMRRILKKNGLPKSKETVIGVTSDLSSLASRSTLYLGCTRGDEIADWLKGARWHDHHVERFVILDDDDDMGGLREHLVQTNFTDGLLPKHIEQAKTILNSPPSRPSEVLVSTA